jgi:phage/plasmid-associated DNA primase
MGHGQARSSDLFAAYQKWCAEEGEECCTQTAFSNELTNRGYDKDHKETGTFWKGLGLNA